MVKGPATKVPKDWKVFLTNDDKTSLTSLAKGMGQRHAIKLKGKQVLHVCEEKCITLNSVNRRTLSEEAEYLFSNQEDRSFCTIFILQQALQMTQLYLLDHQSKMCVCSFSNFPLEIILNVLGCWCFGRQAEQPAFVLRLTKFLSAFQHFHCLCFILHDMRQSEVFIGRAILAVHVSLFKCCFVVVTSGNFCWEGEAFVALFQKVTHSTYVGHQELSVFHLAIVHLSEYWMVFDQLFPLFMLEYSWHFDLYLGIQRDLKLYFKCTIAGMSWIVLKMVCLQYLIV